jgi:hypothetical protein
MEHRHVDQLRSVADVDADLPTGMLTRREKLERWAALLDQEPERELSSLGEIEFQPVAARGSLRADRSPLAVAFADPVLRTQGLKSDRLGDAMAFFEISENQAHRLLCSCMNGQSIRAGTAARQVRSIAKGSRHTMLAAGLLGAALLAPTFYMMF